MSLKGLSEDGTHLIVVTTDGDEHRLAITDEVRELVRHARVMRRAEDSPSTRLSPREIQQRIRAGLNGAELAQLTGEPVEAIRKFEAPVLAERQYIVDMARHTRIGRDATSPTLGDLVGDRLAGRGVDVETVRWDAWREVDEPWKVAADYKVEGKSLRALWTFDHVGKALTAEDDESTWLTETELLEVPVPRRHLSAVRADGQSGAMEITPGRPAAVTVTHPEAGTGDVADAGAPEEVDSTEALLEGLAARRGTRESVDMDDEDDDDDAFEGFGPARGNPRPRGASMPHPAGGGRPQPPATPADSAVAPTAGAATPTSPSPADRRPRKGRASVPSWDEIVFGAKND